MNHPREAQWAVSAKTKTSHMPVFEVYSSKCTASRRAKVLILDSANHSEVALWSLSMLGKLTPELEEI